MSQRSDHEPQVIDVSGDSSASAFNEALSITVRGDKIIYHRGAHAGGTHRVSAMRAQDAGLVALVQKRLDGSGLIRFEYIAQRTNKRS